MRPVIRQLDDCVKQRHQIIQYAANFPEDDGIYCIKAFAKATEFPKKIEVGLACLFSLTEVVASMEQELKRTTHTDDDYARYIVTLGCDKDVSVKTGSVVEVKTHEASVSRFLWTLDPPVVRVAVDTHGTWWFGIQAMAAILNAGNYNLSDELKDKTQYSKAFATRVGALPHESKHTSVLKDIQTLHDHGFKVTWIKTSTINTSHPPKQAWASTTMTKVVP